MTEKDIVILNFSGIYEQENFYEKLLCKKNFHEKISCEEVLDEKEFNEKAGYFWIDLRDLSGCNCYCDDEAKEFILEKISDFSAEGIHFIDSGNYHYMSRIWMEKIDEPFRLLVFDNHTDMQPPAFGGILSCGGWIASAAEELSNLKEIILVGPDEESYTQVEDFIKEKTCFLSRETLYANEKNSVKSFYGDIPTDLPLYISIDKDVLDKEDASTTWSQGDMKLREMCNYLEVVLNKFKQANQKIIGVDICGECDLDHMIDHDKNDRANKEILDLLLEQIV